MLERPGIVPLAVAVLLATASPVAFGSSSSKLPPETLRGPARLLD
jgi:hypothetical protein